MRRLFALLSSLVLVLGLTSCVPGLSGDTRTVTADVTGASGLFVGNEVGILGVPVGKVTKLEPRGASVRVTMEVDDQHDLPEGVGAVIVSRSAATDRYVELTPAYTSGPKATGDVTIPLKSTRVPVEFDEVLGSLGDLADGLSGKGPTKDAVKRLLDATGTTLDGKGQLINNTIGSLSDAVAGISAQRGNAADTLDALDELTQGLATNEATVREFLKQVSEASALLADERQNFRTTLRRTTKMIRVVAAFVKANRAEIRRTINHSNGVMRTVMDNKKEVSEILELVPLASQNLLRMLTANKRLLVRLDPLFLTPLAGLLGPICEQLPGDACTAIGLDVDGLIDVIDDLTGGVLGGLGGRQ